MTKDRLEGRYLPCEGVKTRHWYAWNDLMPPQPDCFHITGEVHVPNQGVEPLLVPAEPQDADPAVLLLDLRLIQKPGKWLPVSVWQSAQFDREITQGYTHAKILCDDTVIATVEFQDLY